MSVKQVSECRRCELRDGCNNVVPGFGHGKIFFVAEKPDEGEDIEAEAFVDRAGHYFKQLLQKETIEDYYLTYAVKCKSKKPSKSQITTCSGWLFAEIEELRPKIICCLGQIPAKLFLKFSSVGDVAGKFYRIPELNVQLAPYYSINYILSGGKKFEEKTRAWLKEISNEMAKLL